MVEAVKRTPEQIKTQAIGFGERMLSLANDPSYRVSVILPLRAQTLHNGRCYSVVPIIQRASEQDPTLTLSGIDISISDPLRSLNGRSPRPVEEFSLPLKGPVYPLVPDEMRTAALPAIEGLSLVYDIAYSGIDLRLALKDTPIRPKLNDFLRPGAQRLFAGGIDMQVNATRAFFNRPDSLLAARNNLDLMRERLRVS